MFVSPKQQWRLSSLVMPHSQKLLAASECHSPGQTSSLLVMIRNESVVEDTCINCKISPVRRIQPLSTMTSDPLDSLHFTQSCQLHQSAAVHHLIRIVATILKKCHTSCSCPRRHALARDIGMINHALGLKCLTVDQNVSCNLALGFASGNDIHQGSFASSTVAADQQSD